MRQIKPEEKIRCLDFPDNIQAGDVYEYLKKIKQRGGRGQTSKEICSDLFLISPQAIYTQISRLKKWGFIKKIVLKYGKNKKIIIFEAV